MTEASKEAQEVILNMMPCIYYAMQFWKDQRATIQALINLGSKVNTFLLAYPKQLGFLIQKADVGSQKIDNSLLRTFGMLIGNFKVKDKLGKAPFFQKSFILAITNIEVALGIPFLILSNANISFIEKELT